MFCINTGILAIWYNPPSIRQLPAFSAPLWRHSLNLCLMAMARAEWHCGCCRKHNCGALQLVLALTVPPPPLMECRGSYSSFPGWQSQSWDVCISCVALMTLLDVHVHNNAILLWCQILYLPILCLHNDYMKGNMHLFLFLGNLPRKFTIRAGNNIYCKSFPTKGHFK